ncbi:uncharacterized protein LOC122006442 isoform X2 [Zingiber officinale]|uniref:uncharacterized protein LOC122006442 isoform X2 n=1 Tax=Zingiber officinale TaxID=94328 RepID=UPI001C4CA1A7|nr:uncharacterized protein LOC122006442 isoform X2 [Zingiber officinale]
MELNLDSGPSEHITSQKEDDDSLINVAVKSRGHNVQKKEESTICHPQNNSLVHDSSVENAESKQTIVAPAVHVASEKVVLDLKATFDAVEDNNFQQEQMNSTDDCLFSSDSNKTSDLHNRRTSNIADEQHKKCQRDNIPYAVLSDSSNANHDHPVELEKKFIGCHAKSSESSLEKNGIKEIQKEVIDDYNNNESEENHTNPIGNSTLMLKNSSASCLEDDNPYPNSDSSKDPHSSSNISSKSQFFCSGSPGKTHLSQTMANVNGQKDTADGDVSKEDSGNTHPQLVSLGGIDAENCSSGFKLQEVVKSRERKDQADSPNSNSETPQVLLQPDFETEVSAETEDDVKVCDICGDAGQDELLAICSRCSDGAEHIYCMRIMLAEVPEGEWLCEECQLKEVADQVAGETEAQIAPTEAPLHLKENTRSKESSVENKATDPDVRRYYKDPIKSTSIKTKEEKLDDNSVSKEKLCEAVDASTGTIVPKKPSQFPCENNNKHDSVKVKPISSTICGKSEGIYHPDSHTQTASGLESSRIQTPFQPTRGPLAKSNSFNNSKVPKVKQLLDNVPWKLKLNREFNLTNKKNEGPSRTITKSASFGSETSGFSNAETSNKVHALNPPHYEYPKPVKGGIMLDKKNSTCDQQFVTPAVSTKVDSNVQNCGYKLSRMSDLSNLSGKRGSIDATSSAIEVKIQPSALLSRTSGSTSVVRLCKNEDHKTSQPVSKAAVLTQRDVKAKDQTSINSRQAALVPNRLPRCHKCNETGHTALFCAVDKLRMTATKPSSERSLKDMDNRGIKWKNVIEGLTWKSGTKRKSADQSEDASLASADVNSEATILSSFKNLSSVARTTDVQNCSKAAYTTHVKQMEDHKKSINVTGGGTVDFSDDMLAMPTAFPGQASIPIDLLRISVIPEMDYIWQGAFEVLRAAKPPAVFDGFQAHLSSNVSPKALEVAGQFPCKVQLKEVPRLSLWPLQFHERSPREDNVAIFFFAKNIESYETYYWKLLDNILKNDLALVGVIGAIQLLIFPSNLLPKDSQRWNNLFYLWGVFRGSQENSLIDLPGLNKKPSVSSLKVEPATQDLSMATASGVCSRLIISDVKNRAVSKSDRLPTADASKCICSDLQDIPTSGKDNEVSNKEPALLKDTLHQAVPDDEVQKKQISCSFPAASASRNMSQHNSVLISHPEPKLQIDIEKLPPEMEDNLYSLDEFASDSDCRIDHENLVHGSSGRVGNCLEHSKLVSLNCWQDNERNVQMLDSWESKSKLKRAHPSSLDTLKNSSGNLLQTTGDSMLWTDGSTCSSPSDEKEHKKMRLDNGEHINCNLTEETSCSRLFSKMQPVPSSLTNTSLFYGETSESSKNTENYFFHVTQGPTCTKADNRIYVSLDDDDSPKSNIPDLELALGDKRSLINQVAFPLSTQKATERNNQDKLLVAEVVDGDDAPASLSLSLAFPVSDKAQTAKSNSEAEQLLPDKSCTDTSLLLFNGCTDR